ncbi:MAG: rhodanese-like domain-containing protein [Parabacteroides sp.]
MKTLLSIITTMLSVLAVFTACSKRYPSLRVNEFEEAISHPDVVLLDVRTEQEFNEGHIPNAINLDVKKDDFESQALASLPKDKTIAVYCRSGKRSKKAAGILTKAGFQVIELKKGFQSWTEAGKERQPNL